MAGRFAGKSVVVAGGTGGLGQAISLAFLKESARVMVTFRSQAEFETLRKASGEHAERLQGEPVDVIDEPEVRKLAESLVRGGGVDALVNTIGAYTGGTPLWQTEAKVLDHMLDLNLRSGFVLSRVFVPVMLSQARGAIVNVSARAAVDHAAGAAAYAASKAAAVALIDCLAADLKGTGVRVNSVLPSIIDTDVNRRAMPDADFAKWPKPADIAQVILFLCSDEARLIHGASVPVYGNF